MTKEIEGCSPNFSSQGMRRSQELSRSAMEEISRLAKPGMTETDLVEIAKSTLFRMGSPRAWHRPVVRFGPNTVYTFSENQRGEAILQLSDIFFLDLGPNWIIEGVEYEGDVGKTYVVGENLNFQKLAKASESLFEKGSQDWLENKPTGKALYVWLSNEAKNLGYELRLNVDGHRIAEFSHQQYFRHGLCEIDFVPTSGLWILEIQLLDKICGYGAFFEDILW